VAVILILLVAVSGIYAVIAYLSPAFKRQTGLSAREIVRRREPSTLGLALWLLLVLATCPWLVVSILGNPLPSELRTADGGAATSTTQPLPTETPRASLVDAPTPSVSATVTSPSLPTTTPTFRPSPTPRPAVTGVALRDLKIFSCPNKDARFATELIIASGKQFRILGWNKVDGTKWYLIKDDGIESQQWVAGSVSVSPPNYSDYVSRASCRVAK